MRKIIITAAAIAALVVPTAAMASVAVDTNGFGSVGKGDVQTALNLKNDAAMQDLFQKDGIKFSAIVGYVSDYEMTCGPANTGATMHRIITQPYRVAVEAKANTNNAGKLTSGWDLTGNTVGQPFAIGGPATMVVTDCPAGSFPWMPVGAPKQSITGITGGLQVNGIALANTPVEVVAPVA